MRSGVFFTIVVIGIVIVTVLALLIWEVIRLRREGKKLSAENAKLSEELQKTQDRERSLRSKGSEIFASIGRELIEPLSGVKFTSELIRTRFLSGSVEEDRDYIIDKLDQIYGKTDQMGIFTKTILSTALDDMGEYTVTCSDTDARSLEDMIKIRSQACGFRSAYTAYTHSHRSAPDEPGDRKHHR